MDTYTEQELNAKTNAMAVLTAIQNNICVKCTKPNCCCSITACFWKKISTEIREVCKV